MKHLTKLLVWGIGAGSILINIAMSGAVIALAQQLRFWAYPTFFAFGMLLSAIVLIDIPWFRKYMTIDESRFRKGFWSWVRQRGAFALVLVTTFFIGPFIGALVLKYLLGMRGRKAWLYASVCNLISTVFWISVYIGVTDWLKSLFAAFFAA